MKAAPKVLNKKKIGYVPKGAVYIGRPSVYGNPFEIVRDGTREEVVRKYEVWLRSNPERMALFRKHLAGKDLVCFCAPLKCHGDVLLKIANEPELP